MHQCVMCEEKFLATNHPPPILKHYEQKHSTRALLVFGFLYYMKPGAFEAEVKKFYDEAGDMQLTKEVWELSNLRDTEILEEVDISSEEFDEKPMEEISAYDTESQSPLVNILTLADTLFE